MNFFKKIFGSKNEPEQKIATVKDDRLEPYTKVSWMTKERLEVLTICLDAGFKPSYSLPIEYVKKVRPSIEIAYRLHAITAVIIWITFPEENINSQRILKFIENNNLKDFMTEDEMEILNLSRDDDNALNYIGRKYENVWPLAWYFGYKDPEIQGNFMAVEQIVDILNNYTCKLDANVKEWVKNKQPISNENLLKQADLFYCVHNAVRSAAYLGKDTVPNNFDPFENGAVIEERRYSLWWMISKGVKWEDTELST